MIYNIDDMTKEVQKINAIILGGVLKNELNRINLGLQCLGLYAKINPEHENQLDFYNNSHSYICSKIYGNDCSYICKDFQNVSETSIHDNSNGVDQTYSFIYDSYFACNIYSFVASSESNLGKNYEIKMFYDKQTNEIIKMSLYSCNLNDEYIKKSFVVGVDEIFAGIDNIDLNDKNHNTISRKIHYRGKVGNKFKILNMCERESTKDEDWSSIYGDEEIYSDNYSTGTITKEEFDKKILNITRHPRNKELINYVLEEYNKMIPGITEYIMTYFPIYNKIMDYCYVNDELTDNMINDVIKEKCNLNQSKEVKSKGLKRN